MASNNFNAVLIFSGRRLPNIGQLKFRELMGSRNIMVINDEALHCYREKPPEADDVTPSGDARKEAE